MYYPNTGYYGQNTSESGQGNYVEIVPSYVTPPIKQTGETKVPGGTGQISGRNLENGKITEFQSRKPSEPEFKFSTIQSKPIPIRDTEPEREIYHNREENNSGFVIPDFIKRIRGKR